MQPEMRTLPDQRIVLVEGRGYVEGAAFGKAATEAFAALMSYVDRDGPPSSVGAVIGYMPDDMDTVALANQRYVACCALLDDQPLPPRPRCRRVRCPSSTSPSPAQGLMETLGETWTEAWSNWFPPAAWPSVQGATRWRST